MCYNYIMGKAPSVPVGTFKLTQKAAKELLIREAKKAPCTDCKTTYPPYVMDFDHIPEKGEKSFGLNLAHAHTLDEVVAEMAKCEVVCYNCHRVRTYNRAAIKKLGI